MKIRLPESLILDLVAGATGYVPALRAQMASSYGDPAVLADPFESRLTATKIGLGVGYRAHYVRTGNDEGTAPKARALHRALGAVSSC